MAQAKKKPAVAGPKPPKVKPAAPSREELIATLRGILTDVDGLIAAAKPDPLGKLYWQDYGARGPLERMQKRLERVIQGWADLKDASPWTHGLRAELAVAVLAEPGTVPTFAFPGVWLEWAGDIPVLVSWGGFVGRDWTFRAVQPAELWISQQAERLVNGAYIEPELGLRGFVRKMLGLMIAAKGFKLYPLREYDRQQTEALRAEAGEWLAAALKRRPVDPIPLPSSLIIQRPLF